MEKDPAARFQSATELEHALAAVGNSNATMPMPAASLDTTAPVERVRPSRVSRRPPRDRRMWWWVAGLAALVLLVTWAAFAFSDGTRLRGVELEVRSRAHRPSRRPPRR
jgi:hypothetical protein